MDAIPFFLIARCVPGSNYYMGMMLAGHTSEEQIRKHSKELTLPVWV